MFQSSRESTYLVRQVTKPSGLDHHVVDCEISKRGRKQKRQAWMGQESLRRWGICTWRRIVDPGNSTVSWLSSSDWNWQLIRIDYIVNELESNASTRHRWWLANNFVVRYLEIPIWMFAPASVFQLAADLIYAVRDSRIVCCEVMVVVLRYCWMAGGRRMRVLTVFKQNSSLTVIVVRIETWFGLPPTDRQ